NVAGWPGGNNWIDSSSLMFRLRIPQIIYSSDEFQMNPKDDDDQMMGMKEMHHIRMKGKLQDNAKINQMIRAKINWDAYTKQYDKTQQEKLIDTISSVILQTGSSIDENILKKY